MPVTLFIPYTILRGDGTFIPTNAPIVDSIPAMPTNGIDNLILTSQFGSFVAGAYQWVPQKNKWQYLIDYDTICSQLFGVSDAYLCFPNAGDNFLPVGSSGNALMEITRNGSPYTTYEITDTGIVLDLPAVAYDIYLVLQASPYTATSILTGGGGIPDAPDDGIAYVRKLQAWEDIQDELNEGNFYGT
jgi:hypothetical protein